MSEDRINNDPGVKEHEKKRKRANTIYLEQLYREIDQYIMGGASHAMIIETINKNRTKESLPAISERQYKRYVNTIRNRKLKARLEENDLQFVVDNEECIDRLLRDKRVNLDLMNREESTHIERLESIKLDAALNTTILGLKYEGVMFLRLMEQMQPRGLNVIHDKAIGYIQQKKDILGKPGTKVLDIDPVTGSVRQPEGQTNTTEPNTDPERIFE